MIDIRRHKKSIEAMDKTIPHTEQALSPRFTAVDYTKTPHVISTISFEEYLKIGLLDGDENIQLQIGALEIPLGALPVGLHQSGATSVRFFDSKDRVPKQRIMLLELIEPKLRRTAPEATTQYSSTSTDGFVRRRAYDENGKMLQADRDDVDQVLEDVYKNIPKEKLDIWNALDLVLPLKKN